MITLRDDLFQVPCGVGQTSCECPTTASECEFDLTINYLQTFASYSVRDDGTLDPQDGYIYNINSSGQVCGWVFITMYYVSVSNYM